MRGRTWCQRAFGAPERGPLAMHRKCGQYPANLAERSHVDRPGQRSTHVADPAAVQRRHECAKYTHRVHHTHHRTHTDPAGGDGTIVAHATNTGFHARAPKNPNAPRNTSAIPGPPARASIASVKSLRPIRSESLPQTSAPRSSVAPSTETYSSARKTERLSYSTRKLGLHVSTTM